MFLFFNWILVPLALNAPMNTTQTYRDGFETGAQWEHGLINHCYNKGLRSWSDIENCVEALYGTGDAELNAVRETYPNIPNPDEG